MSHMLGCCLLAAVPTVLLDWVRLWASPAGPACASGSDVGVSASLLWLPRLPASVLLTCIFFIGPLLSLTWGFQHGVQVSPALLPPYSCYRECHRHAVGVRLTESLQVTASQSHALSELASQQDRGCSPLFYLLVPTIPFCRHLRHVWTAAKT